MLKKIFTQNIEKVNNSSGKIRGWEISNKNQVVLSQILLTNEALLVRDATARATPLSHLFSLTFITPWQASNVFTALWGGTFVWEVKARSSGFHCLPLTDHDEVSHHPWHAVFLPYLPFPSWVRSKEMAFVCSLLSLYPGKWSSCHQLKLFRAFILTPMATRKH